MKFRIPPQTHLERLKLSAMYLSLQKELKRSGWGSIGWGAFTLLVGLLSGLHTLLDSVWLTLGIFLLLEGAWVLRVGNLDPRVLHLEAAALLLLGLWNTVGLYFEIQSGMKPIFGARIIIVGIFQLIGAYTTYRSFPAYKNVYEHLDRACLHELELKMGDMWKRKPQIGIELVEFKADDKKCKARFLPDIAVLLMRDFKQVVVAERCEIAVESGGNKMLSKLLKVQLTIEGETLKAEMSSECYQRWRDWCSEGNNSKSSVSAAAEN
jgi:hypothetical protein